MKSEKLQITVRSEKSADIIMTETYFILKGNCYQLRDGYIKLSNQNISILIKDILSIEYVTMRSKRILILIATLLCILVSSGSLLHKVAKFTRNASPDIFFSYYWADMSYCCLNMCCILIVFSELVQLGRQWQ